LDGVPEFLEYITEADRCLVALYALNSRSDARAIRAAINHALRIYERLLALRESRCAVHEQSIRLQMALDLLRVKLKSFGHVEVMPAKKAPYLVWGTAGASENHWKH
jgi:hypothetical protein